MLRLLMFLVVIFAFAALGWMIFLPVVVTQQLRSRTGFDAKVQRVSVNPFTGSMDLRGFVVTNPPNFPTHEFIELRAFAANARIWSLFSEQLVFDTMAVDLTRITLVKRQDGKTNAQVFEENWTDAHQRLVAAKRSSRQVLVHRLNLKVDRLVIADHSLRQPTVKEFTLGLHQTYVDVTELKQLFAPAVLQNLAPVAAAISGLIPGEMGEVLGAAGKSGVELLKEVGQRAEVKVKGLFDALEESKKP